MSDMIKKEELLSRLLKTTKKKRLQKKIKSQIQTRWFRYCVSRYGVMQGGLYALYSEAIAENLKEDPYSVFRPLVEFPSDLGNDLLKPMKE